MGSFYTEGVSKTSVFSRLLVAFYFALSLPIITWMVHLNPSGAGPGTPFSTSGVLAAVTTAAFLGLWGLYSYLLFVKNKHLFVISFFFLFAVIAAGTVWMGFSLHRDYFSHIFQIILMFWLLFVLTIEHVDSHHTRKRFYSFLFLFNTIIFLVAMSWIILMGYAIATRQEPRWAESIVYNVYNAVLAFIAGVVSLRLQLERFRNIRMRGGVLYIDNWNFSRYFSDADIKIVSLFLTADGSVSCGSIADVLFSADKEQEEGDRRWDCEECIRKQYTATRCPKYKNIYNRILNIKKLFESLEIGTIITPENKRQIKEIGWKLRLFDDVKVLLPGFFTADRRVPGSSIRDL